MTDLWIIGVVVLLVGIAAAYIGKAKKSGVKCIGCPAAGKCSGKGDGHTVCGCGCHSGEN